MSFRAEFEHRDALRRAAIDEFCERGYDAASINRILAAADMSKGQLYHHFTNKEGLYLGLIEWMIDEKARWFVRHPIEPDGDFFETLGALMRASAQFAAKNRDIDRLTRSLLAERGRPIFTSITERFSFDPDSAIGALVAHHYRSGNLGRGLSEAFVRRAVLLVVNNAPELLDLRKPAALDQQVGELVAFLERGLGPRQGN